MLLHTLVVGNFLTALKSYGWFKNCFLANQSRNRQKKKNKEKKKTEQRIINCGARFVSLLCSKEESSHPPADALSVVQDVELVDELIHTVASLGDSA